MAFKYIFFRVYRFYHTRWPKNDPEIYAFWAIAVAILLWEIPIATLIWPSDSGSASKVIGVGIYLISGIVLYYYLFMRNDYKQYCDKEYFKKTVFNSWFGTVFMWLIYLTPLLLIAIIAIRSLSHTT